MCLITLLVSRGGKIINLMNLMTNLSKWTINQNTVSTIFSYKDYIINTFSPLIRGMFYFHINLLIFSDYLLFLSLCISKSWQQHFLFDNRFKENCKHWMQEHKTHSFQLGDFNWIHIDEALILRCFDHFPRNVFRIFPFQGWRWKWLVVASQMFLKCKVH